MLKMYATDYKYEIGKCIHDNKRDFVITNRYKQDSVRKNGYIEKIKRYNLHCNICGADVSLSQSQLDKGTQCPCCTNKQVVIGINDIPTTDPWMIKFFPGGYDEQRITQVVVEKEFTQDVQIAEEFQILRLISTIFIDRKQLHAFARTQYHILKNIFIMYYRN